MHAGSSKTNIKHIASWGTLSVQTCPVSCKVLNIIESQLLFLSSSASSPCQSPQLSPSYIFKHKREKRISPQKEFRYSVYKKRVITDHFASQIFLLSRERKRKRKMHDIGQIYYKPKQYQSSQSAARDIKCRQQLAIVMDQR